MPTLDELFMGSAKTLPFTRVNEAELVQRVEEALTSVSREGLGVLSQQLVNLVTEHLRSASEPVRAAVRGTPGASSDLQAAYLLGQLSFAQHLVSESYLSRADDSFIPELTSPRYSTYVRALAKGDSTPLELGALADELPADVSQKLRHLVTLGIVDFRREGSQALYFLTPLARESWQVIESSQS